MEIGEGVSKTFKIPISHLDYKHIEKCTDIRELEKIYLTLKTGEEGKYPDLELFCEDRLKLLFPESRVLRKATELISLNQLDDTTREDILNDIQTWISDIKCVDNSMRQIKPTDSGDNEIWKNTPIRNKQDIDVSNVNTKNMKSSNKSCKPKDYNEWSKIADELEKQMILEEKEDASEQVPVQPKKAVTVPKTVKGLAGKIDTTNMSKIEKEKAALLEKEKGNEAFKAGDLEEAIIYYTRSLSVEPIAAVYNNRGLVYMKQNKWEEAIRDLSTALKKDPRNTKALQRRATCYSEIHNLQDAIVDCRQILKLSPNNKFAENLLVTSSQELEKRVQPKLKDGKRMVITEIGSDEESENEDEVEEKFTKLSLEEKEKDEQQQTIIPAKRDEITKKGTLKQEDNSEAEFMRLKEHGNQLFKELKYKDALRIYDQLVEGWPNNPIGYRNRAACNLVLDKPQDVIEDCTIAMEIDKSSHLSYYRRGKAYKILKMYEKSCTDLEEALRLSPNHCQIKEELVEVKNLLEEYALNEQKCQIDKENQVDNCAQLLTNITETSNDEVEVLSSFDEQENPNQDVSNTWEFLGLSELVDCPVQFIDTESEIIIDRPPVKSMTKHEFDKQLNNIRVHCNWTSTIQLLVDIGPSNLSSMIGTKLDGFILENIISSLLQYSKHQAPVQFIKTVLMELTKIERFGFIKLMISDHATSELDQIFKFLKQHNKDLAEIDCLHHCFL